MLKSNKIKSDCSKRITITPTPTITVTQSKSGVDVITPTPNITITPSKSITSGVTRTPTRSSTPTVSSTKFITPTPMSTAPKPSVPGIPSNISTQPMVKSIWLSWTAPSYLGNDYNNGNIYIDYKIEYSFDAGDTWINYNIFNTIDSTFGGAGQITNLDPTKNYLFRVSACNRGGCSNAITTTTSTKPNFGPDAPNNVRAFKIITAQNLEIFKANNTRDTYCVDWEPPFSDMIITEYDVEMKEGNFDWGSGIDARTVGGNTTLAYDIPYKLQTDEIIANYGGSRLFRVKANTGGGYGPYSNPVTFINASGLSPTKQNYSESNIQLINGLISRTITISWVPPSTNISGFTLQNYEINLVSSTGYNAINVSSSSTSQIFPNMDGQERCFTVQAVYSNGVKARSTNSLASCVPARTSTDTVTPTPTISSTRFTTPVNTTTPSKSGGGGVSPTPTGIIPPIPTNEIWSQAGGLIVGFLGDGLGTTFDMFDDKIIVASPYANGPSPENQPIISNVGEVTLYKFNKNINQWNTIGSISGTYSNNEIGKNSVSLSQNHLAIDDTGYIKVYSYYTSQITQIGSGLSGTVSSIYSSFPAGRENTFGSIASIPVIAVGSPTNNSGSVRTYYHNGNEWVQTGHIIGRSSGDRCGSAIDLISVSESVTLTTTATYFILAISSPNSSNNNPNKINAGHVRIYIRGTVKDFYENDPTIWQQIGNDIIGDNAGDFFGYSIKLSQDGKVLAVGAPGYSGGRGYVKVYRQTPFGRGWAQIGSTLIGSNAEERFGYSVALNPDGTLLAVGSPQFDDGRGRIKIYRWTGSGWFERGPIPLGDYRSAFGSCVRINDEFLGISSPQYDNTLDGPPNTSTSGPEGMVRMYKKQ